MTLEFSRTAGAVGAGLAISWALFGVDNLVFLLKATVFFVIGASLSFYYYGIHCRQKLLRELNKLATDFKFPSGLPSLLQDKDRLKNFDGYTDRHAMTGNDAIDPILEQILENIMRDFVDSWYVNISTDRLFQESLKRTARRTIAAFCHCVKNVDWTPLLTRHFVDDFASHLRLYRKAKERMDVQKEKLLKPEDLESVFFDLELEMERSYCRDLVSTSVLYESAYLHDIVDILLYLLMPSEDFRSRPLRFLVREIIVTKVLVPVLDKFSDPLYLNYLIVWLLSSLPIGTEDFVTSLDTCNCVQELESILESIHEEINSIRSKDIGLTGDHAESFKQQLASLEFAESLIKRRMVELANQPEIIIMKHLANSRGEPNVSGNPTVDGTVPDFVHLPIMVVLTHQTAVTFFAEFLTQVGGQNFIDFYLSIEGFKVSVEHQLNGLYTGETVSEEVYETVKEAALFMYRQYLSHESLTRIPMNDSIINKFLARVRNDEPFDSWFEQIQEKLVDVLMNDERFYPSFKRHPLYIRMLEDLGIISPEEEEDEDEIEDTEANDERGNENDNEKPIDEIIMKNMNNSSDNEDVESFSACGKHNSLKTSFSPSSSNSNVRHRSANYVLTSGGKRRVSALLTSSQPASGPLLQTCVETLGLGQHHNNKPGGLGSDKMFALYNVRVTKTDAGGQSVSTWNVIRRYSDFHAFNAVIVSKFANLCNLSFPGKKTFNNLDQNFLKKRCKALDSYMSYLLQPSLLETNPGLEAEVLEFVAHQTYRPSKRSRGEERLSKKVVSAMFDPILSGVRAFGTAVTAVPAEVFDGIGKVGSELNRAATQVLKANSNPSGSSGDLNATIGWKSYSNFSLDSNRVAAQINDDVNSESIPLRVLLLFVDEVFGLRGRNQWFRRRLVAVLRQFVNAALGSSINRRIIDAVQWITGADQVAQYLTAFRDSFWGETTVTDLNATSEALRTRFLARCLMLSALPDELRLFIGASTTIHSINNISEALQNRHLNRRFWYVIFERLLSTIFPNNRFEKVLPMLHSKSPRTKHF